MNLVDAERRAALFRSGLTFREIAELEGVSPQAVSQQIKKLGVATHEGGHAKGGGHIRAATSARIARTAQTKRDKREALQNRVTDRAMVGRLPEGVTFHTGWGKFRAFAHGKALPGLHFSVGEAVAARDAAIAGRGA